MIPWEDLPLFLVAVVAVWQLMLLGLVIVYHLNLPVTPRTVAVAIAVASCVTALLFVSIAVPVVVHI